MMDRAVGGILQTLSATYPEARYYLTFSSPLELLVAAILSAQVRDEVVNAITPALFKKYRSARDFAEADPAELEGMVRTVTFYKNKAANIRKACRLLVERHGGAVPEEMDALLELPGVARKTANVIQQHAFGRVEGVVVDTHVIRLAQRLGWTAQKDPAKIERDLMALLDKGWWDQVPHLLKQHGRAVCRAPVPACSRCVVAKRCPKAGVSQHT
ncbi:MAG: endonuclease III [Candidatus Aenigmarchaeota archaeon]|nr:endonuclease III [Candidatus Aenigmarchaeota archaeon]